MVPVDLLNYQLLRLIGRGGMGEVYLARNKNIEQYVAVKALHPKYANNASLRARFKQEAVMLNSLNHPNIVKFLNFVENEYGVFLIMEYVEGYTLEDFITKKNGLIVEEKAYPMMQEILSAFSYAHQRGIIHRDIKPSNIFLDKEGHIKVMDFGIAQIISEVNSRERLGQSVGTPAYMSPEQVYGQPVDQRSDIYSLGVLFHQMLTGRAPYDSTTMSDLEIKNHVVNEKLPRMKNYYPYISEGLQAVVDKATQKDAAARYASCDDMLRAIRRVLDPEKLPRLYLYTGVAVAAVLLLVGAGIWDYFRTKVSYYKDYAEYNGVAKGIGSLSSREAGHRNASYRFESSRWKVRRVTLVNSQDKPVPHRDTEHMNMRFTDTYYYYTDGGQLDYKKVYDAYGKLLYKIDYDENLKVAMFKNDDERGTAKRLLRNTTQLIGVDDTDRSSITRYLLTYGDDGLLQKIEYASGEDNMPVGDAENIYGQAYSYDEEGRIVEIRFLGQDGNTRGNKHGLAIKRYEYDDNDDWVKVTYLNASGKASHDGNNCTLVTIENDKWGNRIAEHCYTIDGKPSYRTDISVCGFTYEYDDDGFQVSQRGIDGNGNLVNNKLGFAQVRFTNNDDGFATRMEYLDTSGRRCNNISSGSAVSMIEQTVDEKGLVLTYAAYDTEDRPVENAEGVHKMLIQYDSIGNITQLDYLDKRLKPAPCKGFYTRKKQKYNDQGLIVEEAFYDKDDHLTVNENGVARFVYTYDKTGNTTKVEHIGKDGRTLVNAKEGAAYWEIGYDAMGNLTYLKSYNSSKKPCMNAYGYHAREYVYDQGTNFLKEIKFYDANTSIIKIRHYEHDGNGNETAYWETNGKGQLQGQVRHSKYDDNNRVVQCYHTNLAGKRVNADGCRFCRIDYEYDERGNNTVSTYYDAAGKPALNVDNSHRRIRKYDDQGHFVYEKNLGKDNKPCSGKDVYPEVKYEYDGRGNMTLISFYDGYGNKLSGPSGFHSHELVYNDQNLVSSECYRSAGGGLVLPKGGNYAKANFAYDSKRNRTEEKYFNAGGTLKHRITASYNDQNSMTEARCYDANGRYDDRLWGVSRLTIAYAADGVTPIKRTYYREGKVYAWQTYDAKTGKWGSMHN